MPIGATILGCAGPALSAPERQFFAGANPLGFILFSRNIETPAQVRQLVRELRACVGRPEAPVLIDQEGGRVARLRPPHWYDAPPAAVFAELYDASPDLAIEALKLNTRLIAADLVDLGIDVDCTPVLDVPVEGADNIIGDRALGADPDQIARLGGVIGQTLLDCGITPVIKHIPGHGRALCDSHLGLPRVDADIDQLKNSDFAPFSALAHLPWAMTAHVVYEALDAEQPATLSPEVIDTVIRGDMGFGGVLLSDDLSMKALEGPFAGRAQQCRAAGCDIALHCNGDMDEMIQVVEGAGAMDDAGAKRMASGRAMLGTMQEFDRQAALDRLAVLLGRSADDMADARS